MPKLTKKRYEELLEIEKRYKEIQMRWLNEVSDSGWNEGDEVADTQGITS